MKQVIIKAAWLVGYGGTFIPPSSTSQRCGVNDGQGGILGQSWIPVPIAGTLSRLTLLSYSAPADVTVILYKNGIATSLYTTLTPPLIQASNSTDTVSVAVGDYIGYEVVGDLVTFPGYDLAMTIEFDGAGQIFGLVATTDTSPDDGSGYFGGALGNGYFSVYGVGQSSNSYSLNAIDGRVTSLALRTFSGAPGASAWTGYIVVNGVLQDGSGGTVDTSCVITGTDEAAVSTFSLRVARTDKVDAVVFRSGSDAPFAFEHVGVGVGFTPDVDGQFMLCGGSNDALNTSAVRSKWNHSEQLASPETRCVASVGLTGFTTIGMYVEHAAPGPGRSWTDRLRRGSDGSYVSTDTVVVVADDAVSAGILTNERYNPSDEITILMTPAGTPGGGEFHWGVPATTDVIDVLDYGVIGPLVWVHAPRVQP
jgi:hypothetical protein